MCSAHYQRLMRHGTVDKPSRTHLRTEPGARFWAKVDRNGSVPDRRPELGPCWLWTARTDRNGYGYFYLGYVDGVRKHGLAHRFAYEREVGTIPGGMEVDHLCRNPSCVRSSHMELVGHKENVQRGESPSTLTAATRVCRRGHKMTADNIYVYPGDGGGRCRKCMLSRQREWREKRRT